MKVLKIFGKAVVMTYATLLAMALGAFLLLYCFIFMIVHI